MHVNVDLFIFMNDSPYLQDMDDSPWSASAAMVRFECVMTVFVTEFVYSVGYV